jgi:putative hydrolase of the HAD superfamily
MDAAAYIRKTMRPMRPICSGLAAHLPVIPGISTVVFDIYGTLIISAAGDIGTAGTGAEGSEGPVLESITDEFGVSEAYFNELFQSTVKRHQAERSLHGVEFPEVEIREVWAEVLQLLCLTPETATSVEEVALRYESGKNPVWAMPGASRAIRAIRESGRKLGIISNAQFYTLPVIEGLFGASLEGMGFDPDLQVFSYRVREGKPSRRLYEILADRADRQGISPNEIFYLGNDMIKDVLPARELGFRTGLFAGDARSLRLGGLSADEATATADAVITDLAQLPGLFHIPG